MVDQHVLILHICNFYSHVFIRHNEICFLLLSSIPILLSFLLTPQVYSEPYSFCYLPNLFSTCFSFPYPKHILKILLFYLRNLFSTHFFPLSLKSILNLLLSITSKIFSQSADFYYLLNLFSNCLSLPPSKSLFLIFFCYYFPSVLCNCFLYYLPNPLSTTNFLSLQSHSGPPLSCFL